MSAPATKQDLEDVTTQLRSEISDLGTQLRSEISDLGTQLRSEISGLATRAELVAMEARMNAKTDQAVSHTANVMMEQIRILVNVVEEEYEHLPGDVAALRQSLDEHRTDLHLHARPPATLPKRAIKKKPRS